MTSLSMGRKTQPTNQQYLNYIHKICLFSFWSAICATNLHLGIYTFISKYALIIVKNLIVHKHNKVYDMNT